MEHAWRATDCVVNGAGVEVSEADSVRSTGDASSPPSRTEKITPGSPGGNFVVLGNTAFSAQCSVCGGISRKYRREPYTEASAEAVQAASAVSATEIFTLGIEAERTCRANRVTAKAFLQGIHRALCGRPVCIVEVDVIEQTCGVARQLQ